MKFELDRLNQSVPDDTLLADLNRVSGDLGQESVTLGDYLKHGKYNPSTLQRRFGSWTNALERAGIQKSKKQKNWKVLEEDLFLNLESVWVKLGRQPRMSDMFEPLSSFSSTVY